MCKKFVSLIFLLIICVVFAAKTSYSEEIPAEDGEGEISENTLGNLPVETDDITFNQAYAEYFGFIEQYNKAHDVYVLKRAQTLKFDSLKSKQEAFDATLVMLQMRDEVVISYLKVLRIRLNDGIGIPNAKKDGLFLRIDDEIEWFTYHRDNLTTTGSLDDLVSDSQIAAGRWPRIDPLAYEVMAVLSQGKITKFSERLNKIFDGTKNKLDTIRNDEREGYSFSSTKFQILDRWVFEADGKIVRSNDKQKEAEELISQIVDIKKSAAPNYNLILSKLNESRLYMSETSGFIKEIIKQVKVEESI